MFFMIRTNTIRLHEAWGGFPNADITNSFLGGYKPTKVYGPARLLRLLYDGAPGAEGIAEDPSNLHGFYWFAEDEIRSIKDWLDSDLKKDSLDRVTYLNRMAIALRNELRQQLAICRNWSPRFDFFARLTVPPQKSVVGLVGTVRGQRVYDSNNPRYPSVSTKDTKLSGGLKQYVINFKMPANSSGMNWIQDALSFDLLYR